MHVCTCAILLLVRNRHSDHEMKINVTIGTFCLRFHVEESPPFFLILREDQALQRSSVFLHDVVHIRPPLISPQDVGGGAPDEWRATLFAEWRYSQKDMVRRQVLRLSPPTPVEVQLHISSDAD